MTNAMNGRCRQQILQQLRQIDFSLVETALYLDAYPDSKEALDYYHRLVEEHARLSGQVEAGCGPLTILGNASDTSWDWVKTPWPWEIDAD